MAIERLFTPVIAVIEIAAAGNTLLFSGPFSQVDKLAAFTAKRSPGAQFIPDYLLAAGWAVDYSYIIHDTYLNNKPAQN